MKKQNLFEVPCRLDNPEKIQKAMNADFLKIGDEVYKKMLALAKQYKLHHPEALSRAAGKVCKDFYLYDDKKEGRPGAEYQAVANFNPAGSFECIEKAIAFSQSIAGHETIFSFIKNHPADLKNKLHFKAGSPYETVLEIKRFLRKEVLLYAQTKKFLHLGAEELKELITAYALFRPDNEDALHALRLSVKNNGDALYQAALAELLFTRIPALFEELLSIDPKVIREKLFSKITKLLFPSRHRAALFGYFKANTPLKQVSSVLQKIDSIADKLPADSEKKARLHEYIKSLQHSSAQAEGVFRDWFLNDALVIMKNLHVPRKLMHGTASYAELVFSSYAKKNLPVLLSDKRLSRLLQGYYIPGLYRRERPRKAAPFNSRFF